MTSSSAIDGVIQKKKKKICGRGGIVTSGADIIRAG